MPDKNKTSNALGNETANPAEKLWGGRFTESTDKFVEAFTASINFDQRLYKHDIAGSKAHAKMLNKVGILTDTETTEIHQGLDEIQADIESGTLEWSVQLN